MELEGGDNGGELQRSVLYVDRQAIRTILGMEGQVGLVNCDQDWGERGVRVIFQVVWSCASGEYHSIVWVWPLYYKYVWAKGLRGKGDWIDLGTSLNGKYREERCANSTLYTV